MSAYLSEEIRQVVEDCVDEFVEDWASELADTGCVTLSLPEVVVKVVVERR